MEGNLNGRQPQLKKTRIKYNINGRQLQWKTTLIEDTSMKDGLNGRRPQDDLNEKQRQ